ncbi:hypothetical protein HFD88_007445 [Aspergillus terreus]|nr:hypothetical protein HFD88_007445 [Aspergillus terreus]
MEWAQSKVQSALNSLTQQPNSECLSGESLVPPFQDDESYLEAGSGTWDDLLRSNPAHEMMAWEPARLDLSGSLATCAPVLHNPMLSYSEGAHEVQTEVPATFTSAHSLSDFLPSDFSDASDISTQQLSDFELDPMCHQTWPASRASQTSQAYSNLQSTSSRSPWQMEECAQLFSNNRSSRWSVTQHSLSPFSIDQQLISATNHQLTSANLLQIYHDVLEHNLSCWLTEMTCPYLPRSRSPAKVMPEWGPSWSNRIYQRTIKLDRVAQSCQLLRLTRSEDRAASKALHLAIMAFATQWAQGSHRQREKYSHRPLNHGEDEIANGITSEFDQTLRNYFWDQAHRALDQVAEVESYRVVCAELIFGLTQRPWDADTQSLGPQIEARCRKFSMDSVMLHVRDIIHREGPPRYMESAARKMHALKYRCDAYEKGLGKQRGSREKDPHGIAAMSSEDQATIGLLYWLAIMFDTISSSMNERPVVVVDEECEHEAQKEKRQIANMDQALVRGRWDLELIIQGSVDNTHQTHWPCSYEAAAEDVIKSAPVKVLIFRHLSYLQNAVRKGSHEGHIEDIISSTMSLYHYWNKTHGAFFGELVQNYSAVPQRIQGWFVCISAHWHLAALLLADLLDFIDENALGIKDATCNRRTSQMAWRIRKHSARELSDLARVATPPDGDINLGVPQMPDFHHAVNEGTLLTEPWTMLLIRAFTTASTVLLGEADETLRYDESTLGHNSHDFERTMERAEDCVKGLWLLGKKSDMARMIADTLSLALGSLRNECVGHRTSPRPASL